MSKQNNKGELRKLAQFYQALYIKRLDYENYIEILKKQGDVNYRLPDSECLKKKNPELIGDTLLHLSVETKRIDIFHDLLSQGADFTIKNDRGLNVLHLAINKCDKVSGVSYDYEDFEETLQDQFTDTLLSVQIKSENLDNPCDSNGISHFHAACLKNNLEAVRYFLKNGVSVNQAISKSSTLISGYTPMHIAAKYGNFETAELLSYDADLSLKDSSDMTPLHVLLQDNLDITNSQKYKKYWERKRSMLDLEKNETIIDLILANQGDIAESTGITPFHVVCTMRNTKNAERYLVSNVDIDLPVTRKSSLWIGYTPLHFAMLFNFDTAKLLIQKQYNLMALDVEGVTPFDICVERYEIQDVHFIVSNYNPWKNLTFSDGKTKLVNLIDAMQDLDKFKSFLETIIENINMQIPIDSSLWPGYTILHLVLYFYHRNEMHPSEFQTQLYHHMITECLTRGADIDIENADGHTSLDLAIRLHSKHVIHLLFQHRPISENLVDKNGLSYLHIACVIKSRALVNKLLTETIDVDLQTQSSFICSKYRESDYTVNRKPQIWKITAGSTALHIAVATGNVAIVKMLLKRGANLQIKDSNDMTPVHWIILSTNSREMGKALLSTSDLKNSLSKGGISYLHVASLANNVKTVKKLLDAEVNANTAITYQSEDGQDFEDSMSFLSKYSGYTALHFAMEYNNIEIVKLLVERGADVFQSYKSTMYDDRVIVPLYDVLNTKYFWTEQIRDVYFLRFLRDKAVQERTLREIGLTMLHFFCFKVDVDALRDYLDRSNVDVNARIHEDSTLWPGYTPLHVLLKAADPNNYYNQQLQEEDVDSAMEMLLDSGADVGLQNAERDTALHVAHRTLRSYGRDNQTPAAIRQRRVIFLLEHLKDITTDSANNEGVSHFHIACNVNHLETVNKFLEKKVDVNQATDYFCDAFPGYSPLHFTINSLAKRSFGIHNQLEIVNLLLNHGSDVNAENSDAETPLHRAADNDPPRESLFDALVRCEADVQSKNTLGKTAFEILLKSKTATTEEIKFFLSHGLSADAINPISKEGYIALTFYKEIDGTVKTLNFETLVESLDVTKANSDGCTAIHNVVSARVGSIDENDYADIIEKLKSLGCDIDCQDNLGRTALHVATWFRNWNATSGLLRAGIDFEIVDSNGKSAFDYIFDPSPVAKTENNYDDTKVKTMSTFVFHVHKLQRCRIDVSEINKHAFEKALRSHYFDYSLLKLDERFDDEILMLKRTKIGSTSSSLHNFLSETGIVAAFPFTSQWEREAIINFFEGSHKYKLHNEFGETASLLKLQFKKAMERLSLIEPAKVSLRFLLKFSFPDLCSEGILRFLTKSEIKSLIDTYTPEEKLVCVVQEGRYGKHE